jgi:hypothetical protein
MTYTDSMRRAFHSVGHFKPKGLEAVLVDNEHFLVLRVSERSFMRLADEDKRRAVEYMARAKKALEDNGAVVLLVREGGKEQ